MSKQSYIFRWGWGVAKPMFLSSSYAIDKDAYGNKEIIRGANLKLDIPKNIDSSIINAALKETYDNLYLADHAIIRVIHDKSQRDLLKLRTLLRAAGMNYQKEKEYIYYSNLSKSFRQGYTSQFLSKFVNELFNNAVYSLSLPDENVQTAVHLGIGDVIAGEADYGDISRTRKLVCGEDSDNNLIIADLMKVNDIRDLRDVNEQSHMHAGRIDVDNMRISFARDAFSKLPKLLAARYNPALIRKVN